MRVKHFRCQVAAEAEGPSHHCVIAASLKYVFRCIRFFKALCVRGNRPKRVRKKHADNGVACWPVRLFVSATH